MSVISLAFLLFLGATATIYFTVPKRAQWIVLLIANYVFYIAAGVQYVPFLLLTTVTTHYGACWLSKLNQEHKQAVSALGKGADREEKKRLKAEVTKKKRGVVTLICVANFGVLAVVKYSDFLISNLNPIFSLLSLPEITSSAGILIPMGISFYTFQAVGYLIDVYRDRAQAEKNFFKTALFLSFFPQLVQGPISRYNQLAPQLLDVHYFDYDRMKDGAILILWGFMKKLVIAEHAAVISSWVFNPDNGAYGFFILLGAAAYSVRVYTDFSGGMDIARGAAQILGIELVLNFERPYFANTIGDFWRRWHITLGSWFRDYVFYPLSLSKGLTKLGKVARTYLGNEIGKLFPVLISQFVVFTLIGIWHGSSWMYIAFGFYHGFLIVGGILFGPKFKKLGEKLHIPMDSWWFKLFQILRTFLLVILGRILTMGGRLMVSLEFVGKLWPLNNLSLIWDGSLFQMGLSKKKWLLLAIAIAMLFAVSYFQEKGIQIRKTLAKQILPVRWTIYLLLIFMVLIFGVYGYGYESSDFIYRGF